MLFDSDKILEDYLEETASLLNFDKGFEERLIYGAKLEAAFQPLAQHCLHLMILDDSETWKCVHGDSSRQWLAEDSEVAQN